MATLNDIYVFVENEDLSRSSTIPQHPVEKGLPITDNVREQPKSLSISGKIVAVGKKTAETIISEIEKLRTGGSLIKYVGRNVVGNFMIQTFDTSHTNTVWGGAEFSMQLVEIRVVKSAYDPSKQKKAEDDKKKTNPTLEVGAIVVFKGGSVYVSSDARTAAANRSRQTCKITKISTKSWSIHQYHLISTEKVYPHNVYGWVDKANIEGAGTSSGTDKTITTPVNPTGTQPTLPTINAKLQKIGEISLSTTVDTTTCEKSNIIINGVKYWKRDMGFGYSVYLQMSYATIGSFEGKKYYAFKVGTPIFAEFTEWTFTLTQIGTRNYEMVVALSVAAKSLQMVNGVVYYVTQGAYYPLSKVSSFAGGSLKWSSTPYYKRLTASSLSLQLVGTTKSGFSVTLDTYNANVLLIQNVVYYRHTDGYYYPISKASNTDGGKYFPKETPKYRER